MASKFDRKKIIWNIANFHHFTIARYPRMESIFTDWFKLSFNGKIVTCRLELHPNFNSPKNNGCCTIRIRVENADLTISAHVDLAFQLNDLTLKHYKSFNLRKDMHQFSFISHRNLLNPDNKYIKNHTLTIVMDVKFKLINEEKWSATFENPDSVYLNSTTFSDFTIVCRDKTEIPAHRFVLARSPVFKAMLDSVMLESTTKQLVIKEIDGAAVLEVMRFLYTGKVENLDGLVSQIIYAASKYDLPRLKQICAEKMIKQVSIDNAIESLLVADQHNEEQLAEVCVDFIRKHFDKLRKNDLWKKLSGDLMHKIINPQPVPILVFNSRLP